MPVRRTRNAGYAQSKEQLSREMRLSRLALFIQQFEKEAQERMNELAAKMENTMATVDKIFKVEMMKMPPSLQNTLIGDLISGAGSVLSAFYPYLHTQRGSFPTAMIQSFVHQTCLDLLLMSSFSVNAALSCHQIQGFFSEETKDEINLDLLDDVAWCQIQRLTVQCSCLNVTYYCQLVHYQSKGFGKSLLKYYVKCLKCTIVTTGHLLMQIGFWAFRV
uniref:Cell division cycle associated 9 n=1 Tax=Seriola lalandi dorsalis TaxID=1841481 RepID=A0A3B4WV00_SERLL